MTNDYLGAFIDRQKTEDVMHYGVKGMRWGVRRNLSKRDSEGRAQYISDKDRKWQAKLSDPKRVNRALKKAEKAQKTSVKESLEGMSRREARKAMKDVNFRAEMAAKSARIMEQVVRDEFGISKTRIYEAKVTTNDAGRVSIVASPRDNAKIARQLAKIEKRTRKLDVQHDDMGEPDDVDSLVFPTFSLDIETDDFFPEDDDELMHYGVKGMKWGVRNDKSSTRKGKSEDDPVKKTAPTQPKQNASSKKSDGPEKQTFGAASGETSAARYSRLAAEAKAGRASDMSDQDLKFFNARTEALNKVNKMYEQKPGWLQATAKDVLQTTAKNQMQSVSNALANKYVGAPIAAAIKGKPEDPDKKD